MEPGKIDYRILVEQTPGMVWCATPDKQRFFFNERWLTFTGRNLCHETGEGWVAGVHQEDLLVCRDEHPGRASLVGITYRLRRHDGVYRWVLEQVTTLYTENRQCHGYTGTCIDITDCLPQLKILRDGLAPAPVSVGKVVAMCAWCEKIRGGAGYWQTPVDFLRNDPGTFLTHAICKECENKFFGKVNRYQGTRSSGVNQ
jgi:PAS domain S-box-containing protein